MNKVGKGSLGAVLIALMGGTAAMGQEELVGSWKVISLVRDQDMAGTTTRLPMEPVQGRVIFTAEGRYLVAIFPEPSLLAVKGDPTAPRDPYQRTIIHSGRYQVSGDKLIEQIELAPGAAMVGAIHKQFIANRGDQMVLESMPMPVGTEGRSQIVTITLERQP